MSLNILIVCGGFLPAKKYGGPVVSIENFVNLIDSCQHYIVTRDHDYKSSERLDGIADGWNKFSDNCQVLYLRHEQQTRKQYINIIKAIKPNVIYINGFYLPEAFIPAISAAKKEKIPVLIAPRGTLCKNAMALKSLKKYLYVYFMSVFIDHKRTVFHSTSTEETERIHSLLRIRNDRIFEMENFPTVLRDKVVSPAKKKGELKCCFFARICPKKNLLSAIKILQNIHHNVEFNVFGTIEDEKYWEICKAEAEKLPSNIKFNYKGAYDHENVFKYMSQNDVFLFPTLSENYGHVIVEALLSRLPVIISDQTPWLDMEENKAGFAFPLNQIDKFSNAIEEYAEKDADEFEMIRSDVDKYIEKALRIEELKKKYLYMLKYASDL